jgi:hypothetical protein
MKQKLERNNFRLEEQNGDYYSISPIGDTKFKLKTGSISAPSI